MASLNLNTAFEKFAPLTHEGARADLISVEQQLARSVMCCLLWEDTFYEDGESIGTRIESLVAKCSQEFVSSLAIKARNEMYLRHVPLLLVREMARKGGNIVAETLAAVIQRPDELAEFLAIYWKDGKVPLSAQVKKGLAAAFKKFNEYSLAKYNRDGVVKLRDVLFLCHAKPDTEEQAVLWKKLVDGTLTTPDTWEVALSSGAGKKETFERLLAEGKLGGLAVLKNLRNMVEASVNDDLIRERLSKDFGKVLPFRFISAAKYAPRLEDAIEKAMLNSVKDMPKLTGKTCVLVDVSGSMDDRISSNSDVSRLDTAAGLAILITELTDAVHCATFSSNEVHVPARRGFPLKEAIEKSQAHGSTYLGRALERLRTDNVWSFADRIIVITDEQSADKIPDAWSKNAYIINVSANKNGIGYRQGWTHINGWSERVVDYIQELEKSSAVPT